MRRLKSSRRVTTETTETTDASSAHFRRAAAPPRKSTPSSRCICACEGMNQTRDTKTGADDSPRALAHPLTPSISSGEQRKPARPRSRARCKAHDEKRGYFTPARDRDEVPLKAREVSVYQALEATRGATEGDNGREKVESEKIGLSYDLGDGRFNRLGGARS